MPLVYETLYEKYVQGTISYYGNSIGLSRDSSNTTAFVPGDSAYIGAFITMDSLAQADANWPFNTTYDWRENSSDAFIEFEDGATVDQAFLMWSGNYQEFGTGVAASDIWLTDSSGTTHTITPDHTIFNSHSTAQPFYFNGAEITTIVRDAGAGQYICGSIPCSHRLTRPSQESAGWCIAIAFNNPRYALRFGYIILNNQDSPGGGGAPYPVKVPVSGYSELKFCAAIIGARPTQGGWGFGYFSGYLAPPYFHAYNTLATPWRPNTASTKCNYYGAVLDKADTTGPDSSSIFSDRMNSLVSPTAQIVGGKTGMDIINTLSYVAPSRTSLQLDLIENSYSLSFGYIAAITNATPDLVKFVDKALAGGSEEITYTMVVTLTGLDDGTANSGGDASNVMLYDTIPFGTTFIPNSVYQDGVNLAGSNPQSGITIGYVTLPYVSTFTYKVQVDSPVIVDSIPNEFYITFTSTLPGDEVFPLAAYSNTVTTDIPPLGIAKSIDKEFVDFTETVTYTLSVSNNGTNLTSVIVIDTLVSGLNLISDSLSLNGSPLAGDLSSGIDIGALNTGETSTITFEIYPDSLSASSNTLPNVAFVNANDGASAKSNEVILEVNSGKLSTEKTVSKANTTLDEILEYTISIENTGNSNSFSVTFIDTMPEGVTFIPDSLEINGTSIVGETVEPPNGIFIGTIANSEVVTLTFDVTVVSVPTGNTVINSGTTSSTYFVNPTIPFTFTTITNLATTTVLVAKIDTLDKTVSSSFATNGQTITYTLSFTNTGNIDATNCVLKDTLPNGLTFVSGSLTINGTPSGDTIDNINLGTVSANETITVEFLCSIN